MTGFSFFACRPPARNEGECIAFVLVGKPLAKVLIRLGNTGCCSGDVRGFIPPLPDGPWEPNREADSAPPAGQQVPEPLAFVRPDIDASHGQHGDQKPGEADQNAPRQAEDAAGVKLALRLHIDVAGAALACDVRIEQGPIAIIEIIIGEDLILKQRFAGARFHAKNGRLAGLDRERNKGDLRQGDSALNLVREQIRRERRATGLSVEQRRIDESVDFPFEDDGASRQF
ncbi:MAG TPA: hypothetical protein VID67_12665, partial [Rhizomicrobium sp.]